MAPGPSLSSFWTQFHPPKPRFTEKQLPDLNGKVYIVTGSNTGVDKEVARILYRKLVFLKLDLSDLNKTKEAAQNFITQEGKLHVLFNNAGVMTTSEESPLKTAQGYENCLEVNCVATHLLTRLLTPTLIKTAQSEPPNTVRVVWLSSFGLEMYATPEEGISLDNLDYRTPRAPVERYGISKCGAWALGVEYARRYKNDGIIRIPINPGNLSSELARDQPTSLKIASKLIGYPSINGAYTELFAGLSPQVTLEKSGGWGKLRSTMTSMLIHIASSNAWVMTDFAVVPFGRFYPLRKDLPKATKPEAEGGSGGVCKFYDWTKNQIQPYL